MLTEKFLDPTYQRLLWENQHKARGEALGRENLLKYAPTNSAIEFHHELPKNSKILEIGSGNGRDARFWALQGHEVFCIDFSKIALNQFDILCRQQGIRSNIHLIQHDINTGTLPFHVQNYFDGFYARSSLHINDQTLQSLIAETSPLLKPNATILILGKTSEDTKINRSISTGGHLTVDLEEGGHLRRVWTSENMIKICNNWNWKIQSIKNSTEEINGINPNYITLIAKKNE